MNDDYDERLLLDASTDELRGLGSTPAARLVRENVTARLAATWLLAQMGDTNTALTTLPGRPATPLAAGMHPPPAHRRPNLASPRMAAGFALALAAIALLLGRPGSPTHDRPPPAIEPITARLDAASDRPFAVFETSNPDIAIVWLLDEETSP